MVEIYTRIYLRRAGMSGVKLRTRAALNLALEGLGSPPARLRFEPNDHQTDALVTAAGMRQLAHDRAARVRPEGPDARDRAKRRLDVRRAVGCGRECLLSTQS